MCVSQKETPPNKQINAHSGKDIEPRPKLSPRVAFEAKRMFTWDLTDCHGRLESSLPTQTKLQFVSFGERAFVRFTLIIAIYLLTAFASKDTRTIDLEAIRFGKDNRTKIVAKRD